MVKGLNLQTKLSDFYLFDYLVLVDFQRQSKYFSRLQNLLLDTENNIYILEPFFVPH